MAAQGATVIDCYNDVADADIENFRDYVSSATSGVPHKLDVQYSLMDIPPFAVETLTGKVSQVMGLQFGVAPLVYQIYYILAPSPECFLPDNTVDEGYAPVANIIAWLLVHGVSEEGNDLVTFDTGRLYELRPGFVEVLGAASAIRRDNLVADFYSQDGADVEVEE
jgi:hypothetical protein